MSPNRTNHMNKKKSPNIQSPLCLPLDSDMTTIESVGGKGHSLAQLRSFNIPVPRGFFLTTTAYRQFIKTNRLQAKITRIISRINGEDTGSMEQAKTDIQALFKAGIVSGEFENTLESAYEELGKDEETVVPLSVAVRSSATAEDLPGMSFAGQQDTYLNITGPDALQAAVRNCWASLWTTRAISYRELMGIDHLAVSMGVVVQKMIPAHVAGIAFTANPATGNRSEMLINASYGLGEAIVGGHVTPDTYLVDRHDGRIIESMIGSKETMIVSVGGQGIRTREVPEEQRQSKSLSLDMIQALIDVCKTIEQYFKIPQDIEWAHDGNRLWILQSRPITNLPARPPVEVQWTSPRPNARLIRRQVVEHMPGPLSPLFDALYLRQGLDRSINAFMKEFGVELEFGDFLHLPFFVTVNGYAYTCIDFKFNWQIIPKTIQCYIKMLPPLLRRAVARWQDEKLPAYTGVIEKWKSLHTSGASDDRLWSGINALNTADAYYWFEVSIIIGLSKVTDNLLNVFLLKFGRKQGLTSGLFLRGFPSKTLETQIDLEDIAGILRTSPGLRELVEQTPASRLMDALKKHPKAESALERIQTHIETYGHQIYSLDFAEPTQGEDPIPLLLSLKALVKNPMDSSIRHARMAGQRDDLVEKTARSFDPFKRWCFRKLLRWAGKYAPYREEALFYVGAAWPTLRRFAGELGQRMVKDGSIESPNDIYYLLPDEVKSALAARKAGRGLPEFKQIVRERRMLREGQKRFSPPPKIPDIPFKFGFLNLSMFETSISDKDESGNLKGFAVSPGHITAPAIIIRSPAEFEKMRPGTILVCPTTTPAWTPLFSQAKGLITEIGSILAHGSIVAREYGIPAVMGLEKATQRITDGQVITVDGNKGVVRIIG